jgi:hypothetical protein
VAACSSCAAGSWSLPVNASCTPCTAGRYGDPASEKMSIAHCKGCPAGKYQLEAGQPFCAVKDACTPGQFESESASITPDRCQPCPPGKYSGQSNLPSCTACGVRNGATEFQGDEGKAFCIAHTTCAAGSKVDASPTDTSNRVCAPCAVGKFSGVSNAVECEDCPAGTYQTQTGKTVSIHLRSAAPLLYFDYANNI